MTEWQPAAVFSINTGHRLFPPFACKCRNPQTLHNTDMGTGRHIIIDIGHANGTGARSSGAEEHAVCATIAKHLRALLGQRGHRITVLDFPGRSNRVDLDLTIEAANAIQPVADLGISLHCDCSDNTEAHGGHVCYVGDTGRRAAENIALHLCGLMPGRAERTVRRADLAVLKRTKPVWVLCECGFISHAGDRAVQLHAPNTIARAIAVGVDTYFEGR